MRWLNLPVILLIMTAGLKLTTGMTFLQALYGGSTSLISAYCFRGIFAAASSLIITKRETDLLNATNGYYTIILIAFPTALIFLQIMRKAILPDCKLKNFLNNQRQLKIVIIYELTAIVNLFIINEGRFLSPHVLWYSGVAMGACLLTIGMLMALIYYSIRDTEFFEYQWRAKMMEEQYALQLRHYISYERYTESFRTFRHDFRSMMITLKTLIREGDNDKAFKFLDSMYNTMQEKVRMHKKYSDNIVLDAMLQDLANICEDNQIRFSFRASVPRNTDLTLINAVRIFSNLTSNAVEACFKTPVAERFMEITSSNEQGWATLQVVNSFNGELKIQNGKFLTTKEDKEYHGLGFAIIKEIIENMGGFIIYDADKESRTFLIRVHIPQKNSNDPVNS
ncbi:GHKL domain-containing protein [Lachnospiraceae bacterium 54-53]